MNAIAYYLKATSRGCGYVPGREHHPGTPVMLGLVPVGLVVAGFPTGLLLPAVFLPVYLLGAYERGKS